GTPLKELSADEFRVLAARYIDEANEPDFDAYCDPELAEPGYSLFAQKRLDTLEKQVGTDAFEALTAEKRAEWKQRGAEAKAERAARARCVTCGGRRELWDEHRGLWNKDRERWEKDKDSDLCTHCAKVKWEREEGLRNAAREAAREAYREAYRRVAGF